jgi:hypothetical protein
VDEQPRQPRIQVNGDLDIQGTLTTTGRTTITPGATSHVYSKDQVNTTFADLINSAPDTLNTLKELASALANDANYATTVQNELATMAPLASPALTGTATAAILRMRVEIY